ncbi:MAG: hypothetical protein ACTSVI_05835, partial [Promethearchaeota archaeon]
MTEDKDQNEIKAGKGTLLFFKFSGYWLLSYSVLFLCIELTVGFAPEIMANASGYLVSYTMGTMIFESAIITALIIFGIFNLKNTWGNIAVGASYYYFGDYLLNLIRRPFSLTLAMATWYVIILAGVVSLLFAIIRAIWFPVLKARKGISFFRGFKPRWKPYHIVALSFVGFFIVTSMISSLDLSKQIGMPVKIEPKDYQIKFRMWAGYHANYYISHPHGTEMLQQLNNHEVTIQCAWFPLRDADGRIESFSPTVYQPDVDAIVGNLTWFWNNYPGIKFQYYAAGVGYGSCGNYEGSIYTGAILKRFVDVCRNYSLPNVVGVYTDWEGPSALGPKYSNETRNGWHQALWTDAMAYARAYFPNWTFSCCYPEEMTWDGVDGDDDLQYYYRYNVFHPQWDDYGPMVYRSCDVEETNPNGFDMSWKIYASAKALAEGAFPNDISKVTMWLGCTGCGPYNNSAIVYEHGKPIGLGNSSGFYAFARDVLILKHFGIKYVSIFLGMDSFESYGSPTGFFDQYGFTDALDRLNETVNGQNSTKSF